LLRAMFIFWAIAVVALSVISYPGSKDLLMSVKLTRSGFVVHGVGYFVGILLCYFSFNRKKDPNKTSVCDREPFGLFHGASGDRMTEQKGWLDDKNRMNSPSEILPAEGIPPGSFHGVKMIPSGLDGWVPWREWKKCKFCLQFRL